MFIKETLLFILPLFFAGLIHHFLIIRYNLFSSLAKPLDCGQTFKGKRILGDSKTFRGFIILIFLTSISMWLLNSFLNIPLKFNSFLCGALFGLGYSLGELPNSFLKRRLNIKEGFSAFNSSGIFFCILDQVDSIIGSLIILPFVYSPSIRLVVTLLIMGTLLHLFIDISLYKFGYKRTIKSNIQPL